MEKTMGITAENKKLELKAQFFNNLAVGIGAGGILVPILTRTHQPDAFSYREWLVSCVLLAVAWGAVLLLRSAAEGCLDKIQD
jgi:hypothetical protein